MVIWGLEPGPRLFVDHSEFVWGLIASLYAANLFTLFINIAFIPVFIKVLKTPFTILAPIIFTLCLIGGYAPTQDMHDVWLMIVFGVVGYLMRKLDYPLAPAVLAIVLGPLAEPALRQSLIISDGEFSIFFTRTYAGPIMVVAIILLFLPLFKIIFDKLRKPKVQPSSRTVLDMPQPYPLQSARDRRHERQWHRSARTDRRRSRPGSTRRSRN